MFSKFIQWIKKNYDDYKYHSLRMSPYFSSTKKKEQLFGLFILLLLGLGYYCKIKILIPLSFGLLSIGTAIQARRGFQEFKQCYRGYIKPNVLKNGSPFLIVTRSIGTITAAALKIGKPIIKTCFYCFSGSIALAGFYDYSFGFNPLREIALSQAKLQTWEQAWYHTTHPNKYINNDQLPYLQDKDEIIQKKEEIIEELKKKLEIKPK